MKVVNELGIEWLSVFSMPPVEFVHFAADLQCFCIGITPISIQHYNPHRYPYWSLRDDVQLRRGMEAAMRDRGVRITLFEGFSVQPGVDSGKCASDLDLVWELGGERINIVSYDPDEQRTFDEFARVAEMGAERGLEVVTEVGSIVNLPTALRAVDAVARPNFKLLLDTMHFFRMGWTLNDLAAIDPARIGHVQLCDATWAPELPSYREEALHERRCPGAGELPLSEFLESIGEGVVVGLEVPRRSLAELGFTAEQRMRPCIDAARVLVSRVRSIREKDYQQ